MFLTRNMHRNVPTGIVTRQAVNSIELGKYVPSTLLALKMAQYFGKTVEELFMLEEGD